MKISAYFNLKKEQFPRKPFAVIRYVFLSACFLQDVKFVYTIPSYYLNDLTIYGTVVCSKITQIPWWTATFFIVTILILLEYSAVRLYFVQRVLYTIHFFKQAGSVVKSYKNSKRIFLLIVQTKRNLNFHELFTFLFHKIENPFQVLYYIKYRPNNSNSN